MEKCRSTDNNCLARILQNGNVPASNAVESKILVNDDDWHKNVTIELKAGEATPFEIESYGNSNVDFATAEVYANPW